MKVDTDMTEKLAEAIKDALACTQIVRDGKIIYDCGNPWEILSDALHEWEKSKQ